MSVATSFYLLIIILIYVVGIALLFYIMILTIRALRLAILALKKYLQL